MFGKIVLKTKIKVLTGMHIGGNGSYSAIGSVDSPVITDSMTGKPIIPGSSLKGKIRTLLANNMMETVGEPNSDTMELRRLFGSSGEKVVKARLQFADAFVADVPELRNKSLTEVKFENTIDRTTLVANPRQIERVISGCMFDAAIVYTVENEDEIDADMTLLAKGMKLLQLDYLGGHGSRGSGRVSFTNFRLTGVACDADTASLTGLFEEVANYELFSV